MRQTTLCLLAPAWEALSLTLSDHLIQSLRRLEPTDNFFARITAGWGSEIVAIGPFRAMFSTSPDNTWLNEAVPLEPLGSPEETVAWLRRLRREFETRGRMPYVEFNEPLWPDLPAALTSAGFVEDQREPIMLCTPGDVRPVAAPGVAVRFLQPGDPDADLAAFRSVFTEVMEVDLWQSTEDVRREVTRLEGRTHALATLDGIPAGTGFISSSDRVAEITRVATLPAMRRRGVAATLTSFMVRDRFAAGDDLVWLTAQDKPAQALYEKLGFQMAGERCYCRVHRAV
ncbi:MAG TPA: GNAT family N-acetyltransferase [Chloroflexota bacterium]|nr:GNAT family N-acetyltransferase [Chloroflexota bacterium]